MLVAAMLCLSLPASVPPETPQPERMRVLLMALQPKSGVEAGEAETITGLIASELFTYPALDVVSDDDVKSMTELEGARQSLGCDASSCLAEVAGALGARLVIYGTVGRLGPLLVLNMSLFDSEAATSVGRQSVEARDLPQLPTALRPALRSLVEKTHRDAGLLLPEPAANEPAKSGPPSSVASVLWWSGMSGVAIGALAAIAGPSLLLNYNSQKADLADLEDAYRTSGDATLLGQAKDLRTEAASSLDLWNNVGLPITVAGGVLFLGGLAVALGSSALAGEAL